MKNRIHGSKDASIDDSVQIFDPLKHSSVQNDRLRQSIQSSLLVVVGLFVVRSYQKPRAHLLELLLALDLELVPRFDPRFFELPVPLANWNFSARLPLLYPRFASSARASSSLTSLKRAAQPEKTGERV